MMRRKQDTLLSSAHGETVAGGTLPTRAPATKHDFEQYTILPDARRQWDLLKFWRDHASEWPQSAQLA